MAIETDLVKRDIVNEKYYCKKCNKPLKYVSKQNAPHQRVYEVTCSNSSCKQKHQIVRRLDSSIDVYIKEEAK